MGQNSKRALECLQRALKIADACKATGMHVPLFVECLDTYLLHYAASSPAITPKYITSLLQLIGQQLAEADGASEAMAKARAHFENTKSYLRAKRKADPRFEEIDCDA